MKTEMPAENNLNELANIQFNALRGLVDKTVDREDVKAITSLSNAIISNAKVQLETLKNTEGNYRLDLLGSKPNEVKKIPEKPEKEPFKFAITPGLKEYVSFKKYLSIQEGMAVEGKEQLIINAEAWLLNKSA